MLKVLKGLAEYWDISVGDLLEGIVLHSFEGKCAFTDKSTIKRIDEIKNIYHLDYGAEMSHRMVEE